MGAPDVHVFFSATAGSWVVVTGDCVFTGYGTEWHATRDGRREAAERGVGLVVHRGTGARGHGGPGSATRHAV